MIWRKLRFISLIWIKIPEMIRAQKITHSLVVVAFHHYHLWQAESRMRKSKLATGSYSIRICNFARLYFAHLISLFGDWFNLLAIMVLMRELGHDGARVLGGIFIAKSLSTLVMLPFSGVIVDRLSRKWRQCFFPILVVQLLLG